MMPLMIFPFIHATRSAVHLRAEIEVIQSEEVMGIGVGIQKMAKAPGNAFNGVLRMREALQRHLNFAA